jgi:pimeloyl-ACP methyl ester carboxylesterase
VFHHGWPLSSGDWDNQMLFFLGNGYRVVGIDQRGHGRSTQVSDGPDRTTMLPTRRPSSSMLARTLLAVRAVRNV